MSKVQYYTRERLSDCISMANYILEGHSTLETAKEFKVSKETVNKNIQSLGYAAFREEYYTQKDGFDVKELKLTYVKAIKMMDKLKRKNLSTSLKRYNSSKTKVVKPATT